MNITILGSSGFLGTRLKEELSKLEVNLFCPSRIDFIKKNKTVVLSNDLKDCLDLSDVIINCIAETNFANCENDKLESIGNIKIPHALSNYLDKSKYFIHLSSDIFYENAENNSEEDANLILNNQYSFQKFESEKILADIEPLIIRTSFVGIDFRGKGILNAISDTINNNKEMNGWINVFSSSVSVYQLIKLIQFIIFGNRITGTYNFGTKKPYSKFEYVYETLKFFKKEALVKEVEYSAGNIDRNCNCGMSSEKIAEELGIDLPTKDGVIEDSVNELKQLQFLDN